MNGFLAPDRDMDSNQGVVRVLWTASGDCVYFSSPWTIDRGKGLVSVFNTSLQGRLSFSVSFSYYELQTFIINVDDLLCALVYYPPRSKQGLDRLFDRINNELSFVLIVCEFNIHVCCESQTLVWLLKLHQFFQSHSVSVRKPSAKGK